MQRVTKLPDCGAYSLLVWPRVSARCAAVAWRVVHLQRATAAQPMGAPLACLTPHTTRRSHHHSLALSTGTHGSRSQLDHLGDGTPSYPQPSPFLTTFQEQQQQQGAPAQQDVAPAGQRLQYGFQDQVPDMQYNRIVTSAPGAGSPTGYMLRPAATMGMTMQDPAVYTSVAMSMNPY
jgi:hypothetical protein